MIYLDIVCVCVLFRSFCFLSIFSYLRIILCVRNLASSLIVRKRRACAFVCVFKI